MSRTLFCLCRRKQTKKTCHSISQDRVIKALLLGWQVATNVGMQMI